MFKPPSLDHQIVIQNYTQTIINNSQTRRIFTPVYTLWAEVLDVKGRVQFDGRQLEEEVTHKITIRYHKFVTSENWILFDNRQFRIWSVENYREKKRWLILRCRESNVVENDFRSDISGAGDPLLLPID
jgi:SPP1 family predicted phage head-tail adaptor